LRSTKDVSIAFVKAKNKNRVVICQHFPCVNQGFYFPFADYKIRVWQNIIAVSGVLVALRCLVYGDARAVLENEKTGDRK